MLLANAPSIATGLGRNPDASVDIVSGSPESAVHEVAQSGGIWPGAASVLSAKQPKGKRRRLNNVGVDPQLPDDVAVRLINLKKRDG